MLKKIKTGFYHLLHPKMAFFLTSINQNGKPNVMTCAWATPVSEEPPIIVLCISKESYSAELIKKTKEFVVNIPTKKLLKQLWVCGTTSGRDTDKFKKAKLKCHNARHVKPPVIEGCIGFIECTLWKTVEAGECYAFFGNVVAAYADDRFYVKGMWKKKTEIPLHLSNNIMVYFK